MLVWCCNASRPPCPSDNIDGAPLIKAHYNINPAPAGPVTLNTFALILSHRAAYCATLALGFAISCCESAAGWHPVSSVRATTSK